MPPCTQAPWSLSEVSHLSTHTPLLLGDSQLCVSISVCAHLGGRMYRYKGPPICAVEASSYLLSHAFS